MKPTSKIYSTGKSLFLWLTFLFYFSINVFSGTHTRYFVSGLNAYSSAQSGCTAANMTATFNIANCSTTAPGNSSVSQTYTVTWYYSTTNASNNTGTGALGSISGGTLQSCGTGSTWTVTLPAASIIIPSSGVTYYYYCVLSSPNFSTAINNCTTGIATFNFTGLTTISFLGSSALSGTVTVGNSGANFSSLTGPGGLFERINSCGLNGNLTANIISNLSESGTNALNQWSGAHTLTIAPGSSGVKTISGNVTDEVIRLNGADNVTINGQHNGSGQFLKFTNTNINFAVISLENSSANNTVKYCLIEGGYNGINLINNTVSGTTIDNCSIYDFQQIGIYLNGTSTITNNTIYSTSSKLANVVGIYILNSASADINHNSIYDLYPASGSAGFGIYYFGANGIAMNVSISNNFVNLGRNVTNGNQLGGIHYVGYSANSLRVYFNTIHIQGTASSGTTYAIAKTRAASTFDVRNNIFSNVRSVSGVYQYANYYSNLNAISFLSDHNDLFVSNFSNNGITSVNNNIFGIPLIYNFNNYKSISGRDNNSVSANPGFVSSTDLHINNAGNTALIDKGVAIAGFTNDFDYQSRTATLPDIGADEIIITPLPVELSNFAIQCSEDNSNERTISWSTASEFNSSHFNLERSRDGMNWEVVYTVQAAGYSIQNTDYSFTEDFVNQEIAYYRIVQFDLNGLSKTYEALASSCDFGIEAVSKLLTYPNPSEESFTIQLSAKDIGKNGMLKIYSAAGQLILESEVQIVKGINEYKITEDLNPGIYFIQITDEGQSSITATHIKN